MCPSICLLKLSVVSVFYFSVCVVLMLCILSSSLKNMFISLLSVVYGALCFKSHFAVLPIHFCANIAFNTLLLKQCCLHVDKQTLVLSYHCKPKQAEGCHRGKNTSVYNAQ